MVDRGQTVTHGEQGPATGRIFNVRPEEGTQM